MKKLERTLAEKLFICLFIPGITLMYLAYKYPGMFVDDAYQLYLFGKSPSFWYSFVYTAIVCIIAGWVIIKNASPYKLGKGKKPLSSYQRNKFISIFLVQLIFFFVLPYILPGLKNEGGFFDDRKYDHVKNDKKHQFKKGDNVYSHGRKYSKVDQKRPFGVVVSIQNHKVAIQSYSKSLLGHQKIVFYEDKNTSLKVGDKVYQNGYLYSNKEAQPGEKRVGVISQVNGHNYKVLIDPQVNKNAYVYVYNGFTSTGGFIYIFVIIPFVVWFFGKRYCSWFCACGNLAETVGITQWGSKWVKNHTPRSETARKWEAMQYIFLIWGILFGLVLFIDAWKIFTVGNLPALLRSYQDIVVDLMFGALIGVGAYPFFGTRIWCRYGCPLAAGMRLYGKFAKSKFQVRASEKCSGIGHCTTVCPMGINVEEYAHKDKKPICGSFSLDATTCIGCGGCVDICPVGALEFSKIKG